VLPYWLRPISSHSLHSRCYDKEKGRRLRRPFPRLPRRQHCIRFFPLFLGGSAALRGSTGCHLRVLGVLARFFQSSDLSKPRIGAAFPASEVSVCDQLRPRWGASNTDRNVGVKGSTKEFRKSGTSYFSGRSRKTNQG